MKPVDLFTRDVHSFWATTFQFELKLFDQFLLRRLGNEPLNAVVLMDEGDLTETLGELTEVDRHVAASANRRYLLRGMRLAMHVIVGPLSKRDAHGWVSSRVRLPAAAIGTGLGSTRRRAPIVGFRRAMSATTPGETPATRSARG